MSILTAGEEDSWEGGQEEPPLHAGRDPWWARGGPGSPCSTNRMVWAGKMSCRWAGSAAGPGSSSSSSIFPPGCLLLGFKAQEELRASSVGNNPPTALSFHPLIPPVPSSEAPEPGDRLDVSLLVTQVCPSWSHRLCHTGCVPPGQSEHVPPGHTGVSLLGCLFQRLITFAIKLCLNSHCAGSSSSPSAWRFGRFL